ncbi:MAG: tonB-system energizer ExbB [Gammaproteobacteria bacterium]
MTVLPTAGYIGRKLRFALVGAFATLLFTLPLPASAQASGAAPASAAEAAAPGSEAAAREPTAAGADAAGKPTLSFDALPHDLSPWAMFLGADRLVKIVMTLLGVASVLTWTVWLSKSLELRHARRKLGVALQSLDEAATLADAANRADPVVSAMVAASRKEMSHFPMPYGETTATGIKERVAARLERIEAAAGKRMRRGTTVLASIGATAPFVGLFGTVWGIMNSFVGISKAQTTNLAVVAPGIAEALLATALGLVAAIPAVLIYNSVVRAVSGYRVLVGDASTLVMCIVSREMDRNALDGLESSAHLEVRRPVAVK